MRVELTEAWKRVCSKFDEDSNEILEKVFEKWKSEGWTLIYRDLKVMPSR